MARSKWEDLLPAGTAAGTGPEATYSANWLLSASRQLRQRRDFRYRTADFSDDPNHQPDVGPAIANQCAPRQHAGSCAEHDIKASGGTSVGSTVGNAGFELPRWRPERLVAFDRWSSEFVRRDGAGRGATLAIRFAVAGAVKAGLTASAPGQVVPVSYGDTGQPRAASPSSIDRSRSR